MSWRHSDRLRGMRLVPWAVPATRRLHAEATTRATGPSHARRTRGPRRGHQRPVFLRVGPKLLRVIESRRHGGPAPPWITPRWEHALSNRVKLALGVLVSLVCTFLILRGLNWQESARAVASVDPRPARPLDSRSGLGAAVQGAALARAVPPPSRGRRHVAATRRSEYRLPREQRAASPRRRACAAVRPRRDRRPRLRVGPVDGSRRARAGRRDRGRRHPRGRGIPARASFARNDGARVRTGRGRGLGGVRGSGRKRAVLHRSGGEGPAPHAARCRYLD